MEEKTIIVLFRWIVYNEGNKMQSGRKTNWESCNCIMKNPPRLGKKLFRWETGVWEV